MALPRLGMTGPPPGLPAVAAALQEQRGGTPQPPGAFGMLSTILQALGGHPPGPGSFVRNTDAEQLRRANTR